MRQLGDITVGRILNDLWEELREAGASEDKLFYINKHGRKVKRLPISRLTFYSLEKRLNLPVTLAKRGNYTWRIYTRAQYEEVKTKIKREYNNFSQLLLP